MAQSRFLLQGRSVFDREADAGRRTAHGCGWTQRGLSTPYTSAKCTLFHPFQQFTYYWPHVIADLSELVCIITYMNKHQEFLKFEAVLAYCEKHVPENSLLAAMDYGRETQFFDRQNSLSASGQLLAEMLMPSIEDRWSEFCNLELTSKCDLYRSLLRGASSETTIRLHRFWRRRVTKWICLKTFGTNYINTFTSVVLLHIGLH